ncbi:hypothetical protein [Rhodococcus chondri]|uniref:Carboxypeptidase regulatory-like domain-containing protein n=1 Tax=Rhodococcus chondri TaxID=3065941 RepID=A0ABU7JVF6_9NOCA|nr:hypothetical protein [Rhodococcus sp. CC-R104]MEE2034006.1 hypothetical protein [Rhodococcus sp. CC-R104]
MHSSEITRVFRIAIVAAAVTAGAWAFATPTAAQDPASHEVPVCAPPDGAPIWVPGQEPKEAESAANGRIGGVFRPHTRIWLTGLDACEQRIDRSVVTTADGSFLFAGLMPGRYALLGENGDVLTRLDLTAESPDQSGLDLAAA